jgi:hypothetical protein
VVAAVDCGLVVNPGPLVAQIEGAVTSALSTPLMEEVWFAMGGVSSANFDDYRLIRTSEVPEIEVNMIKSTDKIGGIGNPGFHLWPRLGPMPSSTPPGSGSSAFRSPRPGCWRPRRRPEVFRRSKHKSNFSKAAGTYRRPCFSKICLCRFNRYHLLGE